MTTPVHIFVTLLLAMLLGACAVTPPFTGEALVGINRGMTPIQALDTMDRDVRVLWGGVIIDAENMSDHTEFTVLYFPLDSSQRPDMTEPPQHRFIARYSGYVETMVYAPGREITVIGSLRGVKDGKVGDAPYRFPMLDADKLYLWPLDSGSKVHFGVGVGLGVQM